MGARSRRTIKLILYDPRNRVRQMALLNFTSREYSDDGGDEASCLRSSARFGTNASHFTHHRILVADDDDCFISASLIKAFPPCSL